MVIIVSRPASHRMPANDAGFEVYITPRDPILVHLNFNQIIYTTTILLKSNQSLNIKDREGKSGGLEYIHSNTCDEWTRGLHTHTPVEKLIIYYDNLTQSRAMSHARTRSRSFRSQAHAQAFQHTHADLSAKQTLTALARLRAHAQCYSEHANYTQKRTRAGLTHRHTHEIAHIFRGSRSNNLRCAAAIRRPAKLRRVVPR